MRGALGWTVAVVMTGLLLVNCGQSRDAERFNAAERERLTGQVNLWKARYAEAAITVDRRVDTVRVTVRRVDTLRQTLNIHDTTEVIRYVAATDTALQACSELADSCALFRVSADSTLHAVTVERDWWRRHAEREARRHKLHSYLAPIAFIGGAALGAWIRGSP